MELNLNLSQRLLLSQRMVLSAKILQMSSIELNDYLKELSQTNPLVEYEEKRPSVNKFDALSKKLDWLDYADEQNRYYYRQDREDEGENWNFASPHSETLEEYLIAQIDTQRLNNDIRLAAEFAAKSLDENGYLLEDAKSISSLTGIDISLTEKAIELLKTLEPCGVGASDLRECLELQLLNAPEENPTAIAIVRDYLDALAKNQLKPIARSLGVSLNEVIEAAEEIKKLNPKPSRGFSSNESLSYIVPDAYIYKSPSGEYEITLNDFCSPSLKINGYYKAIIKSSGNDEAKEYIANKFNQAEWVMKCIEKRNSTFMNTLRFIVDYQRPFFDSSDGKLSPMKLSDVAAALSVHDSTISRAVRDKYIQCSRGIFPLKYFFSSSVLKAENGKSEVSQNSVKQRIKEIIDAEDKAGPLSDRAIGEALEAEGISISRRTVAKYREAMGIAGASVRKDFQKS